MELRHIRYFLAVAEEGNFTRAAARLGIGQPPLSSQIKDLEREVGAQLFHRVAHGAELTEAGRAFRAGVATMPDQATVAIRSARRAASGETGQLGVGLTGTAAFNPLVPAAIRAFRRAYPDVELRIEEASSFVLLSSLVEGRLDVAILRPAESDPQDLREESLMEEPLVAALPAGHPEARGAEPLDLTRLKEDPLILTPRSVGTSLHDAALAACRAVGFEPRLGQPAPQIASILSLVAAEFGVSLVPASLGQLNVPGVAFRTVRAPEPRVGLVVAYRKDRPPQLALNFAKAARAVRARVTG
ncbi:DNA-binding transcriptional LysR family regulator [Angulomicrobium tetraedrale]|uniref:DNA-binding transcriptional LysR family regulator n=1 Tax=Ancylobacter tetraedralis TaxID=217068 RepID=A0A839ZA26_9HYPH|nr:LysR family transcriptional regulator [Ancylobacter tetraedralis]MBB3771577.1 DNA-binding transcriptional LysR family regulator [Ancylobacter tetraedralis]